jgi:hypothetical protein
MKALIARANSPSLAFALFVLSLVALPIIYGPIVGVVIIGAVVSIGLMIFALEVGSFAARIADGAYRSRVRLAIGAAIFALGVLALLFIGGAAYAADAVAAPATPTVSIPWGDWLAAALAGSGSILALVLSWAAKTFLPPIAQTFITNDLIAKSVDYALATIEDAARGKVADVQVSNAVIAMALNWIAAYEPELQKRGSDILRPLIIARLSALGVIPPEASASALLLH